MYARANRAYQKTYLESASPSRLIDEMFTRALRDIEVARTGIETKDAKVRGEALSHAMEIVGAMHAALDRRMAPDLAKQLGGLYMFVNSRLTRANIHNDVKALGEAAKIISHLQETFQQAAVQGT